MCERFVLLSSLSAMEERFLVKAPVKNDLSTGLVVKPGDSTPIITQQEPSVITYSTFGMTPSRARFPMSIVNARAEGDKNPDNDPAFSGSKAIFLKKAFCKPLFCMRCIVPADAFIAWSRDMAPQPYLFFLRTPGRPHGMAGLYDIWKDHSSGELLHSFCIITVPANTLVRKIRVTRMPVILPLGKEMRWLKPTNSLSEILGMLVKYPSDKMNGYPLSREFEGSGPVTRQMLQPQGGMLMQEPEPALRPQQRHYGHKKKGEGGHWLGNGPI